MVGFFPQVAMFTARQNVEYLTAATGNDTCTHLADHLDGDQAVSHDAICDYLRRIEERTQYRHGEV